MKLKPAILTWLFLTISACAGNDTSVDFNKEKENLNTLIHKDYLKVIKLPEKSPRVKFKKVTNEIIEKIKKNIYNGPIKRAKYQIFRGSLFFSYEKGDKNRELIKYFNEKILFENGKAILIKLDGDYFTVIKFKDIGEPNID